MSFRVSANSAEALVSSLKLRSPAIRERARADGAAEPKKSPSPVSAKSASPEGAMRFRLSALQDESFAAQKRISELQAAKAGLREIESELSRIKLQGDEPSEESLKKVLSTTEETVFNGRKILAGSESPVRNESEDIDPVVVAVPPKPGSYTVSLIEKKPSANPIVYTISLSRDQELVKSIKTAISPVNGLIEGVELYFERKESFVANFVIEESKNEKFPLPDLNRDAKKLLNSSGEKFAENLQQFQRKVDTTLDGISRELDVQVGRFQKVATAFENISAAEIDDASVSRVKENISGVSTALLNDTKTADSIFHRNQDAEHIKELI